MITNYMSIKKYIIYIYYMIVIIYIYNRIVSDVLICPNTTRRFRRLFRYPGLPINNVFFCAKPSKRCLHRYLNESHLRLCWSISVSIYGHGD